MANRADVLLEAAKVVEAFAWACREGEHGDEWTSRDVRDAVMEAAAELHSLAAQSYTPQHGDIRSVPNGDDQVYLDGRGPDGEQVGPAGWYEIGRLMS